MFSFIKSRIIVTLLVISACNLVNAAVDPLLSVSTSTKDGQCLDTENIEKAQKIYVDAIKSIMTEQPTTLKGDIARDVASALSSLILLKVFQFILQDDSTIKRLSILIPIFPIIRYLIDTRIRKADSVDHCLDILTTSSNLTIGALIATNVDIASLEEKIRSLGNKKEWARWIGRSIECLLCLLVTIGNMLPYCADWQEYKTLLGKMYNSPDKVNLPDDLLNLVKKSPYTGQSLLIPTAILIESAALAYFICMRSTSYKNNSRMKKIDKLKQLLGYDSKEALVTVDEQLTASSSIS